MTFATLRVTAFTCGNIVGNGTVAYGLSRLLQTDRPRDVAIIVAIDTVFRIATIHALSALSLPYEKPKTIGHLIFPCLTVLIQPLSVKIAQRLFHVKAPHYLSTMAYIFFGWKANMMAKDVIYLALSALLTRHSIDDKRA